MIEQFTDYDLRAFLGFLRDEKDEGCISFTDKLNRNEIVTIGVTSEDIGTYKVIDDIENNSPFLFETERINPEVLFRKFVDKLQEEGIQLQENHSHLIRFKNYRVVIRTNEECAIKTIEIY